MPLENLCRNTWISRRDVEHLGEHGLRHPAFESEPRQLLGLDVGRPVGHFEGRGLECDLALGVEDRLFQAGLQPFEQRLAILRRGPPFNSPS